jgi:hypothetical protein
MMFVTDIRYSDNSFANYAEWGMDEKKEIVESCNRVALDVIDQPMEGTKIPLFLEAIGKLITKWDEKSPKINKKQNLIWEKLTFRNPEDDNKVVQIRIGLTNADPVLPKGEVAIYPKDSD